MAFVWYKIKALNPKKALMVVGLAGFLAFALSYALVSAVGPKFNIFPISYTGATNHDLPMIDARNVTKGEGWSASSTDHSNGVHANPGDVIEVSIYYHNGAANDPSNIAKDVIVKAFASPSLGTKATSHTLSATVGASNSSVASSASAGGNMDVKISGSNGQSLSLVPNSTKIYKDQGSSSKQSYSSNGNIFNGINIGDVRGCFEFHGFVNFKLKVSDEQPPAEGDLTVQKRVKNVTDGTAYDDYSVNADPGETVEFEISVTAINNAVQSVKAKDVMDGKLSLSGSVKLDGSTISSSAFFSGSGVSIGNFTKDQTKKIVYQAKVAGDSSFTVGQHSLPNTVTAFTSSISREGTVYVKVNKQAKQIVCTLDWEKPWVSDPSDPRGLRVAGQDKSNVDVYISGLEASQGFRTVNIHQSTKNEYPSGVDYANAQGVYDRYSRNDISANTPTGFYDVEIRDLSGKWLADCRGFKIVAPASVELTMVKSVRNLNSGIYSTTSVNANPSDKLRYELKFDSGNSNATQYNVNIKDQLPGKIDYISGTFKVNGVSKNPGSFFSTGVIVNDGEIAPNETVTVTFEAQVASTTHFTVGSCETLTNTGTVYSTGSTSVGVSPLTYSVQSSDTVDVKVCKDTPVKEDGQPGSRPTS